MIKNTQRTV